MTNPKNRWLMCGQALRWARGGNDLPEEQVVDVRRHGVVKGQVVDDGGAKIEQRKSGTCGKWPVESATSADLTTAVWCLCVNGLPNVLGALHQRRPANHRPAHAVKTAGGGSSERGIRVDVWTCGRAVS